MAAPFGPPPLHVLMPAHAFAESVDSRVAVTRIAKFSRFMKRGLQVEDDLSMYSRT
jgi:hypothetical protein